MALDAAQDRAASDQVLGPLTVTSTNRSASGSLRSRPLGFPDSVPVPATHSSYASPVSSPACSTPSGVPSLALIGPKDPPSRFAFASVRHYTSRAGDPHRHLHLQVDARIYASGAWRGLHSVGIRDSIEAINGI